MKRWGYCQREGCEFRTPVLGASSSSSPRPSTGLPDSSTSSSSDQSLNTTLLPTVTEGTVNSTQQNTDAPIIITPLPLLPLPDLLPPPGTPISIPCGMFDPIQVTFCSIYILIKNRGAKILLLFRLHCQFTFGAVDLLPATLFPIMYCLLRITYYNFASGVLPTVKLISHIACYMKRLKVGAKLCNNSARSGILCVASYWISLYAEFIEPLKCYNISFPEGSPEVKFCSPVSG